MKHMKRLASERVFHYLLSPLWGEQYETPSGPISEGGLT